MSKATKLDPRTNLPEVPEGYYWKVKIYWGNYMPAPSAYVTLHKKKKLGVLASEDQYLAKLDPRDVEEGVKLWSRRRHELVMLDPSEYSDVVLLAANKVLKNYEKNLQSAAFDAKFKAEAKKLSGKYPPKSL